MSFTAIELIERCKNKNNTDDDWLKLYDDIISFLDENPSEEDRRKFVPLGYLEMVCIVRDGILRERDQRK